MKLPHYLAPLMAHIQGGGFRQGKINHVEIRHDGDCARWKGGKCDCAPEIVSGPAIDRKHGEPS